MTVTNLPRLRANNNVPQLNQAGCWLSTNVNLGSISIGLPVEKTGNADLRKEPIQAIPDPWAQASAFGAALLDEEHSLHDRSLSRWRGLLALMALRLRHKQDFTLRPLPVDLANGSNLAEVLTTLTPEIAIQGHGSLWKEPALIMLRTADDASGMHEKPIAMTNPVCLVSPGRNSHKIVVPHISWAQGDLKCPLSPGVEKLSVAELSILKRYIEELWSGIRSHDGTIAAGIADLLRTYAVDVTKALGRAPEDTSAPENNQSKLPKLFRALWNDVQLGEPSGDDTVSETKVRLKPLPGSGAGKVKGFILADEAVAEALGLDPAHVHVWKRRSLAEVLKSKQKLSEVRGEAQAEGYLLLTKDDLLTKRAVRLKKKPKIDAHPNGLKDMVLPLKPLAMMLAGELKENVAGQVTGNRASFSLKLKIDDGSPDGKVAQIKREYAIDPVDDDGQLVDSEDWDIYNAQLWPNFRSDAWHTYLARFYYKNATKEKMARPIQAISIDLMHNLIASANDTANADIALRGANDGNRLHDRLNLSSPPLFKSKERSVKNGNFWEDMQCSSKPFDAILYADQFGSERPRAVVGMVLVDLESKEPPVSTTRVAIDFGSTNTVGAFGDSEASAVEFQNRMVFPVTPMDQIQKENQIHATRDYYHGFLPPEQRNTPIPSVAIPKLPYDHEEALWSFRNVIYFHSAQPPAEGEEELELAAFREATKDAQFDLKWSTNEKELDAASDFLTQFMVMTAAELLAKGEDPAKSEWRFSIPEAMSHNKRSTFEADIIAALRSLGKDLDEEGMGELKSEGLAAASYMLKAEKFVTDGLNIILDIGGGTTDMTIWDGTSPVWKGSVKLAGGDFFTELLVNNPQILTAIGLESWAKSIGTADGTGASKKRKQLAEMLFSARRGEGGGPDLHSNMSTHWRRLTSDTGNPLRYAALVYIAGLAWYIGRLVKQFIERDDAIDVDNARHAAFAVCGRGGGLFKRMHGEGGRADKVTEVTRALSVFTAACEFEDDTSVRFSASADPKLEVVRGVLGEDNSINIDAQSMDGLGSIMPLGLRLETKDAEFDRYAPLTAELFDEKIKTVDLDEFKAFLKALEDSLGLSINIDTGQKEGAEGEIISAVKKRIDEIGNDRKAAKGKKKDSVGIEPPFLIALRRLVEIMAMPVAQRDGLLEVHGEE